MTVQLYNIHLTNGEVLQVGEDYDLHGAQTIVNRFYKAGDNDILEFQTPFTSMYVPRKHILFIATADVLGSRRYDMEVKINREIRNYTESMFFGLSLRQFVFSLLAVGVAVLLYFVLKPYVGTETVSWMCILGAAPFAAMGFVNYNGMTAEQFVWAWLRSEMLEPKQIKFEPVNIYYEALKDAIDEREKEVSKHND